MSEGRWKLKLFGGFQLVAPDGAVFITKAKRVKLLLAYLALCPTLSCNRKTLATAIFEDEDLNPDSNFALLLTRLGKPLSALSPVPLLHATRDEVCLLSANLESDWQEFIKLSSSAPSEPNAARRAKLLLQALELADGSLLPEVENTLLVPLVEQAEARVLSTISQISGLPLADSARDFVLNRLAPFEAKARFDPLLMEHVLRVYGNFGLTEKLVQVFTDYEGWMQDEYGEAPREFLLKLFEDYSEGGVLTQKKLLAVAERPNFSIGRESELEAARQHIFGDTGSRLMTMVGLSGIGKSHILKELFWRIEPQAAVAYFDLEYVPSESVLAYLQENQVDGLLLDELSRDRAGLVERILNENPEIRILGASHHRIGLSAETVLLIQPLGVGSDRSPAVQLVERNLDNGRPNLQRSKNLLVTELAQLCEGIPLAIEIASKLAASIGLEATVMAMRRDSDSASVRNAQKSDHSSLAAAIQRSFSNLSDAAQHAVVAVCSLGGRLPTDLVAFAGSMGLEAIEEAILSGLLYLEDNIFLRSPQASTKAVRSVDDAWRESFILSFSIKAVSWFEAQSQVVPVDLRFGPTVPTALDLVVRLHDYGHQLEALRLLGYLKEWMGYAIVDKERLDRFAQIVTEADEHVAEWGAGAHGLAVYYFHAVKIEEMARFLEGIIRRPSFSKLGALQQCTLIVQLGLAKQSLGLREEAEPLFKQAIEVASGVPRGLAFAYSNLGVLYEDTERLAEAEYVYSLAARNITIESGPSLQSNIRCSLGRLTHRRGDLDTAQFILVSALYTAMERDDKRGAAMLLTNLGRVYLDKGQYRTAAYVTAMGLSFRLDFGYDAHFLLTETTSMAALAASLLGMGETTLAISARVMVDRLGSEPPYATVTAAYEKVLAATYRSNPLIGDDLASEAEVRALVSKTLAHLKALPSEDEALELSALLTAHGA